MNRMKLFLFFFLSLSTSAFAHPGHGHLETGSDHSLMHYLTEPVHLLGIVLIGGGLIVGVVCFRAWRRQHHAQEPLDTGHKRNAE